MSCNGKPAAGVVVSSSTGERAYYSDPGPPVPSATKTYSTGLGVLANVEPSHPTTTLKAVRSETGEVIFEQRNRRRGGSHHQRADRSLARRVGNGLQTGVLLDAPRMTRRSPNLQLVGARGLPPSSNETPSVISHHDGPSIPSVRRARRRDHPSTWGAIPRAPR